MKDLASAAPTLLNDLYERTTDQTGWPVFLGKLAALFHSDTAALRVTDLRDPVVYHSCTIGFHQHINQRYETESVVIDPFRDPISTSPLGKVLDSTSIIKDRDFERSEHYQTVFRPNGNFYAMGTQFERDGGRGMHIGVHRPRHLGGFSPNEINALEMFSPHLRRVTQLSRLMADLNQALAQANQALDQLPFGVWHIDGSLRVQWTNAAAEEALSTHTYGLDLRAGRLRAETTTLFEALRATAHKLTENQSLTETLKLDKTGACLVITQCRTSGTDFHVGRDQGSSLLCFLLDSTRPANLDQKHLSTLYKLTPAEYRLTCLLVGGLDVSEASALLQISPHTGRTQLKSIMHKAGVSRQSALHRKLLLCSDMLRRPDE